MKINKQEHLSLLKNIWNCYKNYEFNIDNDALKDSYWTHIKAYIKTNIQYRYPYETYNDVINDTERIISLINKSDNEEAFISKF